LRARGRNERCVPLRKKRQAEGEHSACLLNITYDCLTLEREQLRRRAECREFSSGNDPKPRHFAPSLSNLESILPQKLCQPRFNGGRFKAKAGREIPYEVTLWKGFSEHRRSQPPKTYHRKPVI
jgi:hypothetical protein